MTLGSPERAEEYNTILSPVSPKPLHYPIPSNIPVLEKQTDPVFNQTATHMAEVSAQQPQYQADAPTPQLGFPTSNDTAVDTGYSAAYQGSAQGAQQSGGHGVAQAQTEQGQTHSVLTQTHETTNVASSTTEASNDTAAPQASTTSLPQPAQTANDSAFSTSNASALPHDSSQPNLTQPQSNAVTASGAPGAQDAPGVNYQTLLDSLSQPATAKLTQPEGNSPPKTLPPPPGVAQTSNPALSGPPPGLPPKPPAQEQPSIHPNYTHSRDIRDYHPHSHNPTLQTRAPNGLPPPPVASFQQAGLPTAGQILSPSAQAFREMQRLESERERRLAAGEQLDDENAPWTSEIQKKYDHFLDEERKYVTDGNWEQFPQGSRLFVGNLSSERVTKRDIFHIFHKYGSLAQISIKQAYGFVQFLEADACLRAMQAEQGRVIRGKKIHLEISKPQKNRTNNDSRRRSRSPERGGRNAPPGVDRYVSGQGTRSERNRDGRRGRDDYRQGRSPSPRGYRGGRDRSRDRYDGRYRSRSRSPYRRGGRYRSPTPDDLPLPRRAPDKVPEVQIIVLDGLDRGFIEWVERAYTAKGVRVDVLLLSPRLSEQAVIRRQILEGVLAVSRLSRTSQQTGKISLQVFDRRGGADNVRFEEYDNLDPPIAAELVLRARSMHAGPSATPTYGYGYNPAPPPAPAAPQSNLSNLITNLDPSGLQKLLGAMQSPAPLRQPHQPPQAPATAITPDLAKLLGQMPSGFAAAAAAPAQSSPQQQQFPASTQAFLNSAGIAAAAVGGGAAAPWAAQQQMPLQLQPQQQRQPSHASTPGAAGGAPPIQAQGQPDMAEILARLNQYRR